MEVPALSGATAGGETAVDLCNERQRPLVDQALLDDAMQKAVTSGDTVLRQLLQGESSAAEWEWLRGFRRAAVGWRLMRRLGNGGGQHFQFLSSAGMQKSSP